MTEGIPGIADGGLVLVVKAGGEAGILHVQDLAEVRYLAEVADTIAVDIQVRIDEVECFEDIADAAASIQVESALENNVFGAERVGGGDDADHAIGDGDAEIVGGVDGVGADCPGGKGIRDLGCKSQIQSKQGKKQIAGNA